MSGTKVFGWLSLIGGIATIVMVIPFSASGWGEPGTAAYQTYETLNRIMSVLLLLLSCGWLGLALAMPRGYGRWAVWLAVIGSLVMVAGNAAEFWLFSDQSYSVPLNGRQISFAAFGIGELVMDIGAMVGGVSLWRDGTWPRPFALLLILALPLSMVTFMMGAVFLGPAILSIGIGLMLIRAAASAKTVQAEAHGLN